MIDTGWFYVIAIKPIITQLKIGFLVTDHPKQAQSLARHSDINLTLNRYTHTTQGEQSEALERLPDLSSPVGRQAKATGTDGKDLAPSLARKGTEQLNSVQRGAVKGHVSAGGGKGQNPLKNEDKPHETRGENEVRLLGLEPRTYGLKVRCSTN